MHKIINIFNLFRYIKLFDEKASEPYCLLVIDGPASIYTSKLILESSSSLNFKCIVSAHFITRIKKSDVVLKDYMVGWQFTTIVFGLFRFLCLFKEYKKFPNISKVTALSNSECITKHIINNAPYIKDIIVFNEKNPFARLAVSIAKTKNISTSCIQHGAVVDNYFPVFVDRYFTWSEYYSNVLQERVPGLNTVCVGRLGYDSPANHTMMEKVNIPLLVLQPADVSIAKEELLSQFKKIIDVCYRYYGAIHLRPHPSDNIMPDILNYIGDRKYFIHSGPLGEVLSRHLVVISLYSTVLLEAPPYDGLPVQYLEERYSSELMRRCELTAKNSAELDDIFYRILDANYLLKYMNKSKQYSYKLMNEGNMKKLFESLAH